jgi:hypothetical protein
MEGNRTTNNLKPRSKRRYCDSSGFTLLAELVSGLLEFLIGALL